MLNSKAIIEEPKSSSLVSESKIIAKNAGIIAFAQIPAEILTFFNGLIIIQMLGAYNYGLYSAAIGVINVVRPFLTLGLQQSVVRYISPNIKNAPLVRGVVRSSLIIVFFVSTITATLLFLYSDWITLQLLNAPIGWILRTFFPIIIYTGLLEISFALFRAFQKVAIISILQKVILPLVTLIINLLLFTFGSGLQGVIWRDVFVQTAIVISCISLLNRFYPFLNRTPNDYSLVKDVIRFAFPLLVSESIFGLVFRADILLISAFLTPVDVGIYATVLKITAFVQVPLRAIDSIVIPMIAEKKSNTKSVQDLFNLSCHWASLVTIPIVLGCLLIPNILLGVFGNEFRNGQNILPILALGILGASSFGSVNGILTMYGHSRTILLNVVLSFILVFSFEFLLIPRFGITGAALVQALFRSGWALVLFLEVKKYHGFNFSYLELGKKAFGALAIYFLTSEILKVFSFLPDLFIFGVTSLCILAFSFVFYKLLKLGKKEDQLVYDAFIIKLRGLFSFFSVYKRS